jgi:uncharacterized RDD family membrane protein YckC
MIKITDLKEVRFRTTYDTDGRGNRVRGYQEHRIKRLVRTVKTGPRIGHFFIDLLIFQVLTLLIQYLLDLINIFVGYDNSLGLSIVLISNLTGLLLYPFLYFFCEYKWQQTPGKFLTKSVVINEYGNKPSLNEVITRSVIRLIPFEAFSCLGGKYSYGWHDKWSDTFVVKIEERDKLKVLLKGQEEIVRKALEDKHNKS